MLNVFSMMTELTILSVLCPTAPPGRIPLGPCSNTAPSDLLVDHNQPPKRLFDSNTMTCKQRDNAAANVRRIHLPFAPVYINAPGIRFSIGLFIPIINSVHLILFKQKCYEERVL